MKKQLLAAQTLFTAILLALPLALNAADKSYFAGDTKAIASAIIAHIPPPPADDSPAGRADLETLLQVQKDRTPAQIARAKRIAGHSAIQMGAVVFGADFTKENFPRTAALMKELTAARGKIGGSNKKKFNRPRPFQRSQDIVVATSKPTSTSYPSGHSTVGAFWGAMYSAAFPEYKPLFDLEVRETMWCRVIAGVHYPTDTQAGLILGTLTAREMLKAPDTQAAIREIRDEITAYLEKHPEVETRAKQRLAEVTAKL